MLPPRGSGIEKFLSELGWREFCRHLLHDYPGLATKNLQPSFDGFPWKGDKKVLAALWEEFGNGVIQRIPYADTAGFKFVLDEVAVRRPEARKMNVNELIDNRFVKELDDSGFIKKLYR